TDADCVPGPQWLESIHEAWQKNGLRFLAAPVRLLNDGSLIQRFQALDFLSLQGITGASVSTGFHTLCNGANLAYDKQAFLDVDGFAGIDRVASGDDMLLMYKIWKRFPGSVRFLKDRRAIVDTEP